MLKKLTAFLTAAVMVTSVASIPVLTSYADTNSTTEKRVMEKLDRGTVAVKTNGGVYFVVATFGYGKSDKSSI